MSQKALILSFIKMLTLDDHMGDVCDSINSMLWRLGIDLDWDDLSDLHAELEGIGVPDWYSLRHLDTCICHMCKQEVSGAKIGS